MPIFSTRYLEKERSSGKPKPRNIGHDVVRAGGLEAAETGVGQNAEHAVALHTIDLGQLLVVARRQLERQRAGLLQGRRGADGQKIVNFANGRRCVRAGAMAQPTRHPVTL